MWELARFQSVSSSRVQRLVGQRPDRPAARIGRLPADPVEVGTAGELVRDRLEQAVGVDAVVVREGDDVGLELLQGEVARAREAGR